MTKNKSIWRWHITRIKIYLITTGGGGKSDRVRGEITFSPGIISNYIAASPNIANFMIHIISVVRR